MRMRVHERRRLRRVDKGRGQLAGLVYPELERVLASTRRTSFTELISNLTAESRKSRCALVSGFLLGFEEFEGASPVGGAGPFLLGGVEERNLRLPAWNSAGARNSCRGN